MSTTAAITQEECRIRLAAIAGEEHTSASGDILTVAAGNAEQAAQILRFANENGIPVTPFGSGSKQSWGNPVEAGIQLDLRRMNKLLEHAWQDMTCTVEAGCTWAAMQAELAKHGQMVALDPLWPERATVGGVVATNDGGSLRLKYGGLRDLIIGMTVVLADGTTAKTGGKVVKNVAGYDLHKLMTGSYGTLGVITEINFRLHPLETNAKTWTVFANRPQQFERPLRNLLDSQLTPSAVQLRLSDHECELDVKIAAPAQCMGEHEARLRSIFSEMEFKPAENALWQQRELLHNTPEAVVLKISTVPSDLCVLASELKSWATGSSRDMALVAQASGLMTAILKAQPEDAAALIKRLRSRPSGAGGGVVALQSFDLPATFDIWGCESKALPLMKEIKRRFDPNRILNPGRFVGYI